MQELRKEYYRDYKQDIDWIMDWSVPSAQWHRSMEEQQSYFGVLERDRDQEHSRRMNTHISMSNPESCAQENVSNSGWIHESGSLS